MTVAGGKRVYLHKLLFGADGGILIDHISRNKMDNRKSNLRIADKSLNAANSKLRCDNVITGHKNIKYDKRFNRYSVNITKDGKTHFCGGYKILLDAVKCANENRKRLFGDFAYFDDYVNYVEPLCEKFLGGLGT